MAKIIQLDSVRTQASLIDPQIVRQSYKKLNSGLITPSREKIAQKSILEHTAEPIKNMEDIVNISQHLIVQKRYRDNMLFIVGINFGLRVSDLVTLRFGDLINDDFTFKDRFPIMEKKTKNTRKVKRNRYIAVNTAVMEAVTLYLENTPGISLSDYMFRSQSNNGSNANKPIHRATVDAMLKGIASDLGLKVKMSTHTLRKTFAYHQMVMSGNDPRKLFLLQQMFGHSTALQTLTYIGITNEEINEAYQNMNLGSRISNYLTNSNLTEGATVTARWE